MSGNIKKEDMKRLANLARISLSEIEQEKFLKDAELILGYFEELKQADIDGATLSISLKNRSMDIFNIADEDEANQELSQKGIESFPYTEKGCLRAPRIIRNSDT